MRTLFGIWVLMWLASCAAPRFENFSMQRSVNDTLFAKFMTQHSDVKVYVAHLAETLVERDAVGERRIINENSDQPWFPVVISDKEYDLIFFKFKANGENQGILLSTAYDQQKDSKGYLNLGPAFYGEVAYSQFNAFRKLKLKEFGENYSFVPDKKELKIELFFLTDVDISKDVDTFSVKQIVQKGSNKIAGSKPIIFDIEKVFHDSKALMFVYDESLSKKFNHHGH